MEKQRPSIKCPYCHIFSQMDVQEFHFNQEMVSLGGIPHFTSSIEVRRCIHCGGKFFYENGELKYPEPAFAVPEKEMPEDVKILFEEAASISNRSPRAACALLRLAIEQLCNDLNVIGDNIDAKIASLVKRGLTEDLQKALDVVRVVGNNAVHPGQIYFDVDDISTANMLFGLVNIITRRLISEPNSIQSFYNNLPKTIKEHVAKRDKK